MGAELSQKPGGGPVHLPRRAPPGFGPFGVPGCRVLWPPAALEEGGGGVGKPGGGGGLWAAAVGGGDAAGRGRRGDMRWARHRAGERGSELISVGGGGGAAPGASAMYRRQIAQSDE